MKKIIQIFLFSAFCLSFSDAAGILTLPKTTVPTDSMYFMVRKIGPDSTARKYPWGSFRDTVKVLYLKTAHDTIVGDTGHFALVLTGVVGADTVICKYGHWGYHVHYTIPKIVDTSNATTCTFTGVPASLRPGSVKNIVVPSVENNSGTDQGILVVGINGIIQPKYKAVITSAYTSTFTASAIKGLSDSAEVDYNL